VTTLIKVASMSAGLITDGSFLPNGRMLLRGYGQVFVLDRPESVKNRRISTLADERLPEQDQGESITVTEGGRAALIGSEGKREPVLRIPVPTVAGDPTPNVDVATATLPSDVPDTDPVTGTATGTAAPGLTAEPTDPTFVGVGTLRIWALVIGGGIAVAGLTAGALRYRTRGLNRGSRR
jgi:hypothetical protein